MLASMSDVTTLAASLSASLAQIAFDAYKDGIPTEPLRSVETGFKDLLEAELAKLVEVEDRSASGTDHQKAADEMRATETKFRDAFPSAKGGALI